ncbi:MAG: hypothetical protein ACJ72N_25965 [Labedaea sp.]
MSSNPPDHSPFVDSITIAITRRVDSYLELLETAEEEGALRAKEAELLDQFERYAADILDRYQPPGTRNRESLVFAHLYEAKDERALITRLLAAEVESRGPLRLTQAQNGRLARIFEGIGEECRAEGLPLHAALAFERAAGIYLLLSDNAARDRCLYARIRATQQARRFTVRKGLVGLSWILCGYGYKPYWLLAWVGAQLAVFTFAVALTVPGSIWHGVYISLTNYLDPQGSEGLSGPAQVVLVAESYVSAVSLSVFFALLVHRWFRI